MWGYIVTSNHYYTWVFPTSYTSSYACTALHAGNARFVQLNDRQLGDVTLQAYGVAGDSTEITSEYDINVIGF